MPRPSIVIVCPATSQSNSGNWRTAERWRRMTASFARARIVTQWTGEPFDLMIALHARRSARSIAAWDGARMQAGAAASRLPLIVVLTGTDLYRDIESDPDARRSLQLADALVVLQEQGPLSLPPQAREKATVIYQSSGRRRTLPKTRRHLRAIMVGHLRNEKSPQTLFDAARLLRERSDIRIDHVGAALDSALAQQAARTARACPGFRWLGAQPHSEALRRIQRSHLLISASSIEGGAHAVLEAICAGTPVLASRIPGNIGMLGTAYSGYFPCGDAQALADLLQRCRDEPRLLATLCRQCRVRAPRFEPAREQRALRRLIARLMSAAGQAPRRLDDGPA